MCGWVFPFVGNTVTGNCCVYSVFWGVGIFKKVSVFVCLLVLGGWVVDCVDNLSCGVNVLWRYFVVVLVWIG